MRATDKMQKNKCVYFLQTEVEIKQTLEIFAKKTPIKRSKHLINIVFDLKDDSRKKNFDEKSKLYSQPPSLAGFCILEMNLRKDILKLNKLD